MTDASNSESLKKLYSDMLLIRRFEERAGQLYGMGLIGGFCHLYIGQEAVVVGMQSNTTSDDQVITAVCNLDACAYMHGLMIRNGLPERKG